MASLGARILARVGGALLGQAIGALIVAAARESPPAHARQATEESPFTVMMRESEERDARCRKARDDCLDRIRFIDFDTLELGRASCNVEHARCLGP